ncbi:MAG: hypothetical protein QXN62_09005 [Candidatus Bathyarchaeia archaeon]|nr:hypothetical protein [Candidatus Bathyarchaeota archaeon]
MEVIDSRFLLEYFFYDKEDVGLKTSKHLKHLLEKRIGTLPTIVIAETIRYVCEKPEI